MKNEEINLMNEEECWEKEYEIGPYDYDDPFPMDPVDEDAPYTTLEGDFEKYQEELQKEAEEEEDRRRFL